ncbi:MAG: MFS transporter, partial [Sulfurimonas sp.]|nr:MFS transporter [Sulfurimonas sp.]
MNKKALIIIIYNIMVVISVMYATQPLQPLLAKEFSVSMSQASLFTAVIMFWLGVAPIIYGYILESVSSKKMLIVASVVLFFTNLVLGFSTTFEMFLVARCVEGLVVPAILTSSMTILANIDKKNIQFNMSIYVAATVFGGLVGRVMSGFIATEFGWRAVFFSLSFALLVALFFVKNLKLDIDTKLTRATLHDVFTILKDRRFALIYLMMFCVFFVFAGLLNMMPFRMKELFGDVSETTIGLLYLGYGSGIVVALLSRKIVKFFGGEIKTILIGGAFYTTMTLFFVSENMVVMFVMMFLLCIGMFTVHSIATGLANTMKKSQKGLTSGMYLTFYYVGGAVGSIVPS